MKSIFIKRGSKSDTNLQTVNKSDIIKSIPENNYKSEQPELGKIKTEFRWRFFNIKNKKYIEISCKESNGERVFFNNNSWVPAIIDPCLEKYIDEEYYYYTL